MKRIFCVLIWAVLINCHAHTITIGTAPEDPPLSFQADNKDHFYGFEIDIMNTVCHRLGLTCNYKPVIVSTLLTDMNLGKVDFAIAGLLLPQKPLKGIIFSAPYLRTDGQFITLKTSPIRNLKQIKNKTIGIRQDILSGEPVFKHLLLQLMHNQVKIKEYANLHALISALSAHEIDAIFSNEISIKYWYYNHKMHYKLIDTDIPMDNNYTIISTPKYQSLMTNINQQLIKMMRDGSYVKIYNRYFSKIPL